MNATPGPAPAPGIRPGVLGRRLTAAARWDAEYGQGLSSHLPMALVALHRLGADARELDRYAAAHAAAMPLRPARRATWDDAQAWTTRLGQPLQGPALRDFFARWLARDGLAGVLRQALPVLMPGCAAAAFHGLIRTAYGVQAGHAGEVAEGLAHWAAHHRPLGPMPPAPAQQPLVDDPAVLLAQLAAGRSTAPRIVLRMVEAARGGRVSAVARALRIDAGTPQRLSRAAAFAYANSGNFTALHLVTGTHAMRVLAACAGEPPAVSAAWRWFWQAYAHGVVAARLQPAAQAVTLLGWDDLVQAARTSSDEHVIKLVDSCREETRVHGGDDWRAAASRAVALDAAAQRQRRR